MNDYEYLIIGSGAGGSAAAYALARAGRRVLLLEQGAALPRDGSTLDVTQVFRQGRFKNPEAWQSAQGALVHPNEFANLGGKTKWYGAALLRFSPLEFEADPAHRYLGWPIAYADLAPYYTEAEQLLGIQTFAVEPDLHRLLAKLQVKAPAWQSQPLPLGLSHEILQYPVEAKHFDGFASVRDFKADGQTMFLDKVNTLSNLTVLTGKTVVALHGQTGKPLTIGGVSCDDGSRYEARTVLLAAGALNSPRLLQTYVEDNGLSSDWPAYAALGRYYKCHMLTAVLAVGRATQTDLLRKTTLLLNDAFPHSSVQTLGWIDGELLGTELPAFTPTWVANMLGRHAYGFFLQTEDGSHIDNRIQRASGAGHPRLDYDRARTPEAAAEHRALVQRFQRDLFATGYLAFAKNMQIDATAHACGTLVTGKDPRHSVVDAHGQVHGFENLYVVDGSVLPRASRVNPALTIYAWALRAVNELIKRSEA